MARSHCNPCLLIICFTLVALASFVAPIRDVNAQAHNYNLLEFLNPPSGNPESSRIYTQLLQNAMSADRESKVDRIGVDLANEMMNVYSADRYSPLELKAYVADLLVNPPTKDITATCYANDPEEIRERCPAANAFASSVYIQLMDTVRRPDQSVKFDNWDPWVGATAKDDAWFDAINDLGKSTGMQVLGMAFGKQNDELLNKLVRRHSRRFSGIIFVNEFGHDVCWTQLEKPRKIFRYGMLWNWVQGLRLVPRYLMSHQDEKACASSGSTRNPNHDKYVNSNVRDNKIQDWILPVFPCYGGREWRCFEAFQKYPQLACDTTKQRYAFSPYRYSSSATLRYYLDQCSKHRAIPGFDLVEVI